MTLMQKGYTSGGQAKLPLHLPVCLVFSPKLYEGALFGMHFSG